MAIIFVEIGSISSDRQHRHVRYREADVLKLEHSSSQYLMTLLGIKREFEPEVPEAAQGLDARAEDNY